MAFTAEQRRKALETRQRNRAAKAERATTLAPADPEPDAEASVPDDVISNLIASLAGARNKKQAVQDLGQKLSKMSPKDHPELVGDPAIQAFVRAYIDAEDANAEVRVKRASEQGVRPGTQIGTGLGQDGVPWHYTDLDKYCTKCGCKPEDKPEGRPDCGICPCPNSQPDLVVGFIPPMTMRVTWNGLECQFNANEEMPPIHRVFVDVYRESMRLKRISDQHKAFLFGESDTCPPELLRGDQAVGTMKARAFMSAGPKKGGGSVIVGYGGDEKFGYRDLGGGEQVVVPTEAAG